jgi:hypothetical protein
MPDGSAVPMWGLTCGGVTGTPLQSGAPSTTCAALNPTANTSSPNVTSTGLWSPVVITVPTGEDLNIALANNLTFTPMGGGTPNLIPTSLVIVGQLGGGLGNSATSTPSPDHTNAQPVTWPIAGTGPGVTPVGVGTPPVQGARVQSFGTEVVVGTPQPLCWGVCGDTTGTRPALKPGTYLIESGTHPSIQGPMGLYGVLVVTSAPNGTAGTAGTAYPAVGLTAAISYNADIPLLLSEIDPAQNEAVDTAVRTAGFSETAVWVQQGGPVTGFTVVSGGAGYASPPTVSITGGGGSGATATVTVSGGVVTGVTLINAGNGYSSTPTVTLVGTATTPATVTATAVFTGNGANGGCGTTHTCYPPAVNYTPLYYLINGLAFDKTHANNSLFAASAVTGVASGATGKVLVRLVNGGLRMHVPAIVGAQTGGNSLVSPAVPSVAGFSLIAEDGNVLPGVPRVQSEAFMPAGKTQDVMIDLPTGTTALPIYDRELSLSANAIVRDAGMLAYIGVNGAGLPTTGAFAAAATAAQANPDSYYVVGTNPLVVSDPAKGVLANDVNVLGVQVQGTVTGLTMSPDGTFTYTGTPPTSSTPITFTYCGNGQTSGNACTTVTLAACTSANACHLEAATGIAMSNVTYNANATFLKILPPGILSVDRDGAGYPLTVNAASVSLLPCTSSSPPTPSPCGSVDENGGFNAYVASAGTYSFTYKAQNSQGTVSSGLGTVTLVFPTGNGPTVTVLDGKDVFAARQNAPICTTVPSTQGCITPTQINDYRWIIEEDRTFYVDPNCTTNTPPAGCPGSIAGSIVPTFGTNFHTSYMPVIAAGCTGQQSCEGGQTIFNPATATHDPAVCDVGNGVCRPDATGNGFTPTMPSSAHLDPTKHYYLTIFPGDAGNPFENANLSNDCGNGAVAATNPGACGHGMGGTPLVCSIVPPATTCAFNPVTVLTQPDPYPPSKLSVFVFEDDFPLNGEVDGAGGVDVIAPQEPGLGGFNITLFDDAGGTGDSTGQMTYDMFNQPLVNSLAGTKDPATGLDACPITKIPRIGPKLDSNGSPIPGTLDPTQTGITGTIVTCPKYESDGTTLSPLAGQAVIANLMPGRYGVVATPAADRIARGEEWLQTNTLDGQKAHDSFLRIGEPSFFQEFGPAGYHVAIGFANPAIINARLPFICAGQDPILTGTNCNNTLTGFVSTERMSRTPDERLYGSGSNDSFAFTQCYVSVGDADGEDFAFTKCDGSGHFTLPGLPDGTWRITVFDQWNDMLVDGLSTPVKLAGGTTYNIGEIAMNQWQANIYTRTFFDEKGTGVANDYTGFACNQPLTTPPTPSGCNTNYGSAQPGLTLVATNIRFRDGSYSNFNNTDLAGNAGFNEVFPLFSWYVIETDSTRYKNTGTHVVYDAGGPADGTPCGSVTTPATAPCGNSSVGTNMANTFETVSVPDALRVPGAVYCDNGDCAGFSIANGPSSSAAASSCTISTTDGSTSCTSARSTGRIDPPWVTAEGWQGFSGQNSFIEFGKAPFAAGENGGIHGEVIYASTRPFDDPQLLLHTSWTPDVPGVTINLYQVGAAPDGTQSLTLVDTTKTSSWDDWAQGFRSDGVPNMNCPGQLGAPTDTSAGDLFYFTLQDQPMWLDVYNHGGTPANTIPNHSQFKCYDGMHNWNQVQPAYYDGAYQFPSIIARNPTTGAPTGSGTAVNAAGGSRPGTNCTVCVANPTDGTPMLPDGQYVVEMVVPPGYELVKEEDKNILIGDNYIAPVTVQFPGLGGAIYIMPDQASVAAVYNGNQGSLSAYNPTNAQNPTQTFGRISSLPSHEGDTGSVESFWPCVGKTRIVPDYISLFPQSAEVAPFAGAKRNLCDRKLVQLDDQTSVLAKFWVFTSAHVASHFTGVITDDFTSEFDPFSPTFGEKFSPANLPVAIKDWTGQEISRVYSDQWGTYNGLTYSTWEVNPPNPTGYAPQMMVTCMNDPGSKATPDPLFNPAYSQFCYETPFMPGQTQYMDTPVVPTSAFAGAGYNNPDCAYPDTTPAISEVDIDSNIGPWAANPAVVHTVHIYALGTVPVSNYGYSGPAATKPPFNAKTVMRKYSFGGTAGTVQLLSLDGTQTLNLSTTGSGLSWTDLAITASLPAIPGNSAWNCPIQQQAQYKPPNTTTAQCGQLVITSANTAPTGQPSNARQSIDTVTVTIGGKTPTHVGATASIQTAIDKARPGDMLIIDPATQGNSGAPAGAAVHEEMLLMWKPVRLQGVGAGSSVINANTHPAGKMDDWRQRVNCLFGLALNGQPLTTSNPYDATGAVSCPGTGWSDFAVKFGSSPVANAQVDRIPLEGVLGWDVTVNGNLAELLQEPSLMGAYEGAGITVLSKGVKIPAGTDGFGTGAEGDFPANTTLLSGSTFTLNGNLNVGDANNNCHTLDSRGRITSQTNPFPSNFTCNPSAIDGLTVTNSSQGGGGIFVHGWGHDIQIANNRVVNNSGTLGGGINVGQGEFPEEYLAPQGGAPVTAPGSCRDSLITNLQLPYCLNLNVNLHHNAVTLNSSIGDELFSGTPAGAGGVNICTGADYYKFNYNWICGNLSSGDGGGLAHLGFSYNGAIAHNSILFNQSTNPTITTNGGGVVVMGTAPDAPSATQTECGSVTDVDCQPGLSDGAGPGLVIDANLIQGNGAESGSGGGLRLQNINGVDVATFPGIPSRWYGVTVTNNIITNNVAGWDGGGVSLQDALNVNIINNTIVSNDTTASSGVLFDTLGAPLASSTGTNCIQSGSTTKSCPQPAGIVAIPNSSNLTGALPASVTVVCPAGHFAGWNSLPPKSATNANCRTVSYPELYNNVVWQNRAFSIGVGALGIGPLNQQNVVTLFPTLTQPQTDAATANGNGVLITGGTGACVAESAFSSSTGGYWDIGVRGDTGPSDHTGSGGAANALTPAYSVLTDAADYPGLNNTGANPTVLSQYCNGARVPPENGGLGYNVPAGIADATVPNPKFSLTPTATVDEGNNWINISWGPLSLSNPSAVTTAGTSVNPLGNYAPAAASPVIGYIPSSATTFYNAAPPNDFFGNPRKNGSVDAGAVEFQAAPVVGAALAPASHGYGTVTRGGCTTGVFGNCPRQVFTLTNTGNVNLTGITQGALGGTNPTEFSIIRLLSTCGPAGNGQAVGLTTLAPGASCIVTVQFAPVTAQPIGPKSATVSVTDAAGTQTSNLSGTAR